MRKLLLCSLLLSGCSHMPQSCDVLDVNCIAVNTAAFTEFACMFVPGPFTTASCYTVEAINIKVIESVKDAE